MTATTRVSVDQPASTTPPPGPRRVRRARPRARWRWFLRTARERRRQRSLTGKLLLALAAVLSMSIVVTSVGGYFAYRYFDSQITRVTLALGDDHERPAAAPPGSTNFLLVGSDSRAGTGNMYQRQEVVAGERSDTTMLAHLDANGTTTLVSFPRDTLVRVPGHGRNKLNSAITTGGPSLLIKTIENLTDIKIDHFVSIDLAGFKAMTDAIGGVTVCVRALPDGSRSNLRDDYSQWRGVVGENHLDGEQALAFVRQRYGLPDGDFDRIRRQQQFISAVFQKATSSGVLTNPAKLEGLLTAATGALTVDADTTADDLRNLATRLRGMSANAIRFETIPVHSPTRAEGANAAGEIAPFGSVQIYDPDELETFLAPLRGRGSSASQPSQRPGTPTPVPTPPATAMTPTPTGRTPLRPSAITLDVLNGTPTGGLATNAARELAAAGFRIAHVSSAANRHAATSLVRYGPGSLAAARTVAAAVPGAQLREDPSLSERVTLVLGTGFKGVNTKALAVTPGPTDAPTASPEDATRATDPEGTARPDSGAGATDTGGTGTGTGTATGRPASTGARPSPTPPPPPVTAAELTAGCTF
ncbi:LCP family protein [Candidatus Protofrankia datiscae]|uniref:Cell envelope-related transcriptional attenuator n=2 Tax=Protofrankia TaxID=2994361 RepID=F8B2J1_9ACTN|nr:cell envelope-related transcriptional attenuator [Candidatus Protofrankia datiscae]